MYIYAKGLCERGYEVFVITTNAYKFRPAKLKPVEKINGCITIFRLPFIPLPFKYIFLSPKLMNVILKTHANVIVVFSILPSFFIIVPCILAKILRIPLIMHPQFNPQRYLTYKGLVQRILGTFFDRKIVPLLLRKANHIIVLTEEEEAYYNSKLNLRRTTVIYGPLLIPIRKLKRNDISRVKQKYGLHKHVVILSVGRIIPYKGFQFLIAAMAYLTKTSLLDKAKLIIVGEDWGYLNNLYKLAKKLKVDESVIFTGRVDSLTLHALYEIADVVVVPSLFEAYGRVLVEAWFYKKPVVASKYVALSKLASKIRGAIITDPVNIRELAQAILRAINSPELGENGYKFVIENMLPKKAIERLELVIKRIMKHNVR